MTVRLRAIQQLAWATGVACAGLLEAHCGGTSATPIVQDAAANADADADAGADAGGDVAVHMCVADMPCNPPGNVCQMGTTSCTPAGEVCGSLANAGLGTPCGTNQVCNQGACVACASGVACNPSGNPCQTGVTSCASGAPTCVPMGNAPDGASCGAGEVCSKGACTACVAGAPCTPAGNPCQIGATSCSTGQATCLSTGDVADGTACTVGICCGGTCAACSTPAANQTITCSVKTCTFACKSGYSMCDGGACVDTTSNSSACGPSCMVCPSGTSCANSKCGTVKYGYSTEFSCGGAVGPFGAGILWGEPITISTPITVTTLGLFANNPAVGVHAILALYTDSAGAPSRLKTYTASTAITNGDNALPVLSAVSVPAGTYWIAGEYDASASICTDVNTQNLQAYVSVTYGTVPDPFGTGTTPMGVDINYYVVGTQ
jgi:hypothetical protein